MDWLDALQWPAMVVTVLATWLVASTQERRRAWGFWLFIASNVLWVAWGLHDGAYALIALQFCLAAMNVRGARKSEAKADAQETGQAGTRST
jgi:hypothetical protein